MSKRGAGPSNSINFLKI
jgi:hypothetical protein